MLVNLRLLDVESSRYYRRCTIALGSYAQLTIRMHSMSGTSSEYKLKV